MNKIQYLNSLTEAFDKEVVDAAIDLSSHYSPKEIVPRLKAKFGKSPAESTIRDWVKKRPVPKERNEPSEFSFPRDLGKLTPVQTQSIVDDWAKEPLKALRKRQRLVHLQIKRGVEMGREAVDPAVKNNLLAGLANLYVMDRLLIHAIDKKEFSKRTPVPEKSMTKDAFVNAYKEELVARYSWASDTEKLDRFMLSVKRTLEGGLFWNKDGDAVNAAWRRIGGKGVPTYKALQALEGSTDLVRKEKEASEKTEPSAELKKVLSDMTKAFDEDNLQAFRQAVNSKGVTRQILVQFSKDNKCADFPTKKAMIKNLEKIIEDSIKRKVRR